MFVRNTLFQSFVNVNRMILNAKLDTIRKWINGDVFQMMKMNRKNFLKNCYHQIIVEIHIEYKLDLEEYQVMHVEMMQSSYIKTYLVQWI